MSLALISATRESARLTAGTADTHNGPRTAMPHIVAASSAAARVLSAAAQLVSIPLLTSTLGAPGYAAYVVLLSLSSWFGLVEFGIGSALQNLLSEARTRGESDRELLRTASALLLSIGLSASALFAASSFLMQRVLLAKLLGSVESQPPWLLLVIGLMFLWTRLGMVGYRVYFARHLGHWMYIHQALASVAGLVALIALRGVLRSPFGLAVALVAWNLPVALWAAWAALKTFPPPWAGPTRPVLRLVRPTLSRSSGFFLFNLLASGVLFVDYLIMSQTLGARDIASYSLITRGFNQFFVVFSAIQWSFWPLMTESFARGDWRHADRLILRLLSIGTIGILIIGAAFLLAGEHALRVLAPGLNITISASTIGLCSLYFLVRVWCDTYATVLQSRSDLGTLWRFVPAQAVASILGQYYLSRVFGLEGTFMALIVAFGATVAHALPRRYQRVKRERLHDMSCC